MIVANQIALLLSKSDGTVDVLRPINQRVIYLTHFVGNQRFRILLCHTRFAEKRIFLWLGTWCIKIQMIYRHRNGWMGLFAIQRHLKAGNRKETLIIQIRMREHDVMVGERQHGITPTLV